MKDMQITYAKYISNEGVNATIHAIIDDQEFHVPIDTRNRHYAEIMRQVEAGELTIQDAE